MRRTTTTRHTTTRPKLTTMKAPIATVNSICCQNQNYKRLKLIIPAIQKIKNQGTAAAFQVTQPTKTWKTVVCNLQLKR